EVASSGGDELLDQIQKQRRELLTGTGKPSGDYARALQQRDEQQAELQQLDEAIARYRQQVDTLAALLVEQRRDEGEQPWLDLREQAKEVQARLEAIHLRRQQLEQE